MERTPAIEVKATSTGMLARQNVILVVGMSL